MGVEWASSELEGASATLQLYRNIGEGGFDNVTQRAGLDVSLYGMGVAVGDYDNDGDGDVFVSGYRRHVFLVNQGDGTFEQKAVGIGGNTWGTGAAFF